MKRLNIYNHVGVSETDNKAIKKALKKEIDLYVDEYNRVWTEGNIYIADVEEVDDGCGIGCIPS